MDNNKFYEQMGILIGQSLIEEEKNTIEPDESIYPQLKKEFIEKFGVDFQASFQIEQFCKEFPVETRDIILKYYDICKLKNEKAFLIDCLYNKKNSDLIPFFIKEFYLQDKDNIIMDLIANCLEITADKKYANEYLKIYQNQNISVANHGRILWVFKKLKMGIEIPTILERLDTEQYCINYMLDCLSVYKDIKFLPIFEKYLNHNDSYTRGIAKRAIAKIEKKEKKNDRDF